MNRQEKQSIIESIKNDYNTSQSSFIVGVKGITVEAVQLLRKDLRLKGSKLKVAKNTFLKIATSDMTGINDLAPYFKEQIAIVFVPEETTAVAKILFKASKENANLILVAGSLKDKVIGKSQIEFLATLPAREVLLGTLCGTLKAPVSGLVSVLNQLVLRLLWVLKQAAESKK